MFCVDSIADPRTWDKLYQLLAPKHKSPFFTSAYYRAYAIVEAGDALCFRGYKDDENFLFYPFIKKSINSLGYDLETEYFDISGAYGYNGPIGKVADPSFVEFFNSELREHLVQNKIVSEFVRYCPITENRRFHNYTTQIDVLDNVYIDLSQGLDYVWEKSYAYRARKTTRKGESYGLQTHFFAGNEIKKEQLDIFFSIYESTMQRNAADDFYYFSYEYFMAMHENLGNKLLLLLTYYENIPISTELILLDAELAFGFLGGTLSDYYQYKANTFQRWELIKYLEPRGYKKYSMGGGASRGDSIYDFKMTFAQGCDNPFYIGTHVHLPEMYHEIVTQHQKRYPMSALKYGNLLQGYRKMDA